MVKIEVDQKILLNTFASLSTKILEDAEEAFEGSKDYYETCFKLCDHLQFVRITCINNGIPMPKWYSRDLDRLKYMYSFHLDLGENGKPKYSLFYW